MSPQSTTSQSAVKILKVSEERTLTPQGQQQVNVVITFTVGAHGPFTERFDKATFDPVGVNAKLLQFSNQLLALGGL